jgi:hypothetical protein
MLKCHHCKKPAAFSICSIASTLGERPRRQRTSPATRLCRACVRLMSEDPPRIPIRLFRNVSEALQALTADANKNKDETQPSWVVES